MSAKKTCVSCGKQIPGAALVCVFCAAKQPGGAVEEADAAAPRFEISSSASSARHQTDPTLVGIHTGELDASPASEPGADAANASAPSSSTAGAPGLSTASAEAAASERATTPASADAAGSAEAGSESAASAATPASLRHTASLPAVEADEAAAAAAPAGDEAAEAHADTDAAEAESEAEVREVETPRRRARPFDGEPWSGLGRGIMGIGGAVLMALFFCPWHGVSSWQLLETLAGADFVRQLFYLTGGIVLLATAILPLPFVFRAAVGTAVAALPVLLGGSGVLDGWRGIVAALAVLALPATHLLRSRARASSLARLLVLAAVAAVALLYLAPVSSVIPVALVVKMITSGSLGSAVLGLFVLIPLVFAGLSLLGVMGRDLTEIGVLLSVLILLWAPVTVALRGLMIDDGTQLYVALALLWASATAALSLAQLLSVAAARAQQP